MNQEQINILITRGKNITHFLQVKDAHQEIDGIPITQIINGINIMITWHKYNTNMYYTDSKMFTDIAIKLHTKMLFNSVSVKFSISKPLSHGIVLI